MNINSIAIEKKNYKDVLFDLLALTFIFFVPTLSHLTTLPLYYFEPMRILLLISLVHTSKKNVFVLTFLLPLFSFIVSAHPSIYKAFLISSELTLNVFLFLFITKYFSNYYLPMAISILVSKLYYYLIKFFMLQSGLISGELFTSPFVYQFIVTILVTVYIGLFYNKEIKK
ncbi:MAG: hypothetical protein N2321_00795 [Melioribacteraceae bacterium]|nr:hypothetical protein [Melioribacteraceae bacterium]